MPGAARHAAAAPDCQTVQGVEQCQVVYNFTGSEQGFQVPSDIAGGSIQVTVIGAAGQNGEDGLHLAQSDCQLGSDGGPGGSGGQGAQVSGQIAVSANQTLYVEVGGTPSFTVGYGGFLYSYGGWNGGGSGGDGTSTVDYNCGGLGGGGGGASDVQTCSISASNCTGAYGSGNDPRLIVAGGGAGGGGGGASTSSQGFSGGGAGQDGTGDGTSSVVGGTAGVNSNGTGGNGGTPAAFGGVGGGGGGGGGYYGGGGGTSGSVGGGAGGGGGSNLVPSGGTSSLTSNAAEVVIRYYLKTATSVSNVSGAATYGGTATLSATLKDSSGNAVPAETVSFSIGGQAVCGSNTGVTCPQTNTSGTATLSGVTLPSGYTGGGTYTGAVSASFDGDAKYASSTGTGNLVVNPASQTLSFVAGSIPASEVYQGTFTPSATSSAGLTSMITVSGVCSMDPNTGIVTMTSGTGTCTVYANQAGNNDYSTATEIKQDVTATKANQATLLVTGPTTGTYGSAYTLTASGGSGTGTVTFDVGGSTACSILTSGPDAGMLFINSGTGTCDVTATKAADDNYTQTSSAKFTVIVNKADLSVTANDKAMTYGAGVPTFDATVTGLVNFDTFASLGGSCGATVNGSPASSSSPAGTYAGAITCSGVSTINYSVSYSSGTLTINQATSSTTISSSGNPTMSGQTVTFSASVTPEYAGTPSGTVNFFDGTAQIGSGTLNNGRATFSTTSLSVGPHSITASYGGDANFLPSASSALTQQVDTSLTGYPTLSGGAYNLSNLNLSGAYLVNADLTDANMTSAKLYGANLSGARLSGATMTSANFSTANLTGADLSGTNLSSANFKGANLTKANLTGANLTMTNFKGATGMDSATLSGVTWSNTLCPDNTLSNKDGGTCLNDLNP